MNLSDICSLTDLVSMQNATQTAGMNATTLVGACLQPCVLLYGDSIPDIAGTGMTASILIQLWLSGFLAVTLFFVVVAYNTTSQDKRPDTVSRLRKSLAKILVICATTNLLICFSFIGASRTQRKAGPQLLEANFLNVVLGGEAGIFVLTFAALALTSGLSMGGTKPAVGMTVIYLVAGVTLATFVGCLAPSTQLAPGPEAFYKEMVRACMEDGGYPYFDLSSSDSDSSSDSNEGHTSAGDIFKWWGLTMAFGLAFYLAKLVVAGVLFWICSLLPKPVGKLKAWMQSRQAGNGLVGSALRLAKKLKDLTLLSIKMCGKGIIMLLKFMCLLVVGSIMFLIFEDGNGRKRSRSRLLFNIMLLSGMLHWWWAAWCTVLILQRRDELSKGSGVGYQDRKWDLGQIMSIMCWLPIVAIALGEVYDVRRTHAKEVIQRGIVRRDLEAVPIREKVLRIKALASQRPAIPKPTWARRAGS